MSDHLLRIGDFSQLAQVSVPTLRHYDEVGLLKPAQVDKFTEYRYYALEQLPRLNRILALKDLGLSLDQIKQLLTHQLPAEHLRELLANKRGEIAQQLQTEQQRLARVEARLRQIEDESAPPKYEVVLRKVDGLVVAGLPQPVPHVSLMGDYRTPALSRVYDWLREQGVTASGIEGELMLYHNTEYSDEDIQMEAAVVLSKKAAKAISKTHEQIKIYELPAQAAMATTIHHGMLNDIPQAIIALFGWIGSNAYHSAGAIRELHLSGREVDMSTEEDYAVPVVMEMQIPVARQ
jgi:DNA-binding transcriptional MerR regulator/effector-binding domain-containing protein